METRMIPLDIISDPICPWCYIGKVKLDRALEAMPEHPFDIRWRPYMLNPNMEPEGMDRRIYLEAKFGGQKGAIDVYGEIARNAEAAGIDIAFEKITRTPSTIDPHRLIHWARLEGKQTPVVSQLFKRFFREGEDISKHEVLLDIAKTVDMDTDLVARLLASDADIEEIREDDRSSRAMGVTGVPCFIIDAKYVLRGAQDTDTWRNVITEITTSTLE